MFPRSDFYSKIRKIKSFWSHQIFEQIPKLLEESIQVSEVEFWGLPFFQIFNGFSTCYGFPFCINKKVEKNHNFQKNQLNCKHIWLILTGLTLWSWTWWLCYTSNCLYWVFDIALEAAVCWVQPDFPVPPLDPGGGNGWGGWGAGHGALGPCTPLAPNTVLWFGTAWKKEKNTKLFTLQDKFRKWLMAVGHKSPSHKKEEICLANLKRIVEVNFQIIVVSL